MNDYLIQHALKNVWCSPDQDHQYLFQPARLTRPGGVRRQVDVEWATHALPDSVTTYHVYQIGQLSPLLLNLIPNNQSWYTFTEAVGRQLVCIDAYVRTGQQLPRFECYFKRTSSKNLIIAIADQPLGVSLKEETLFVRFYSNAFFSSDRYKGTAPPLITRGVAVRERRDVVVLNQTLSRELEKGNYHINHFKNGWLVDGFRPDDWQLGDRLEYVLDASVCTVHEMALTELPTFISTLDQERKYLVHRPKDSVSRIDFHDDVDFWLVKKTGARETGVFLHKLSDKTIRMVTHRDFSVSVEAIVDQLRRIPGWFVSGDVFLKVVVRESGYSRVLVPEKNRLEELYRLDDDQITGALIGANANLPFWQAATLEASDYTDIMRSDKPLTAEQVQSAYGYHAIASLVAKSPLPILKQGNIRYCELPIQHQTRCTVFEYDKKGRLIEGYRQSGESVYTVRHEITGYVEVLFGWGSLTSNTVYARYCSDVREGHEYRAYVCDKIGDIPTYEWRVAEPLTDYVYHNRQVVWLIDPEKTFTAVREDRDFIFETQEVFPHNGMLTLDVRCKDQVGELKAIQPCPLPFGQLDVFLNGHSLIEGLDYFVQWPKVVICNKVFLKPDSLSQTVSVRAYGFLDEKAQRRPPTEHGFVKHGLLSVNSQHDVRLGKVQRIVANGRLWTKDEVWFEEDQWGLKMPHLPNGTPYQIQDLTVPLIGLKGEQTTHQFKAESDAIDLAIGQYLDHHRPEKEPLGVNMIPARYAVFSPFLSRIHFELLNGYLYPDGIKEQYSDEDIKDWLKPYEWILAFDPLQQGVDTGYVAVHPHDRFEETKLDIYQYTFLKRVAEVYAQDKVSLSSHVRIKEGWV